MSDFFIGVTVFVGLVVAFIALLAGIYLPIRQIDHALASSNCPKYAEEGGYRTKFVDYNFFNYSCLAERSDGKWVDVSRLRESDDE